MFLNLGSNEAEYESLILGLEYVLENCEVCEILIKSDSELLVSGYYPI